MVFANLIVQMLRKQSRLTPVDPLDVTHHHRPPTLGKSISYQLLPHSLGP